MKKLSKTLAIGLLSVVALNGCSLFAPHCQSFTVTASEADAKIYINGEFTGNGLAQTKVKRNKDVAVLVKKEGFHPAQRSIDKTLSPVGIVDLLGGAVWIVPFVGLLAPGAYELEEQNITVLLDPIVPKPLDTSKAD